jgi:hypothetical protein
MRSRPSLQFLNSFDDSTMLVAVRGQQLKRAVFASLLKMAQAKCDALLLGTCRNLGCVHYCQHCP